MLHHFLTNLNIKNFVAETNENNAAKPVLTLYAIDYLDMFRSVYIRKNRLAFRKTPAYQRLNEQNGITFLGAV